MSVKLVKSILNSVYLPAGSMGTVAQVWANGTVRVYFDGIPVDQPEGSPLTHVLLDLGVDDVVAA